MRPEHVDPQCHAGSTEPERVSPETCFLPHQHSVRARKSIILQERIKGLSDHKLLLPPVPPRAQRLGLCHFNNMELQPKWDVRG